MGYIYGLSLAGLGFLLGFLVVWLLMPTIMRFIGDPSLLQSEPTEQPDIIEK